MLKQKCKCYIDELLCCVATESGYCAKYYCRAGLLCYCWVWILLATGKLAWLAECERYILCILCWERSLAAGVAAANCACIKRIIQIILYSFCQTYSYTVDAEIDQQPLCTVGYFHTDGVELVALVCVTECEEMIACVVCRHFGRQLTDIGVLCQFQIYRFLLHVQTLTDHTRTHTHTNICCNILIFTWQRDTGEITQKQQIGKRGKKFRTALTCLSPLHRVPKKPSP